MQLGFAFLAEGAEFTRTGKLAILGGNVDVFRISTFPATVPALVLVLCLTVDDKECDNPHLSRLEIVGPSREILGASSEHAFQPKRNPPESAELPIRYVFMMNLVGLTLTVPGVYLFRVFIDGDEMVAIPAKAVEANPAGEANSQETDASVPQAEKDR